MHGENVMDEHHAQNDATDIFGFWLYILTDCILFACLFATFIVLSYQGHHVADLKRYIDLYDVMTETYLLLASSFTFCLAMLNLEKNKFLKAQWWLAVTFLLGAGFIFLELKEFIHLATEGFRWDVSGQASGFFTLVGTHGFHVSCGLLWILVMILQLPFINRQVAKRRLTYLSLFWGFLDIVWIFVFTIVYLVGAM